MKDEQISNLKNKFEILQLNERVVPYLMQRFECKSLSDVYNLFTPKLLIVTHAKDGAEFVFDDKVYSKKLVNPTKELDATGAGDAFLSVFVKNYYDNGEEITDNFIDDTFEEATKLTSEVVQNIGARGHIYAKRLEKNAIKEDNKNNKDSKENEDNKENKDNKVKSGITIFDEDT